MSLFMEGLIDTFLPSATIARRDREKNASAARGLLSVYQQGAQDPQIGGGQMGGGPQAALLAQQGQLPPQFYQRLGTVPGYEQALMQDQTGGQAMQRQLQSQQNEQQNMPMSARMQLEQQQRQWEGLSGAQQAALKQQQVEHGGLSAYQQAMLDQQQAEATARAAERVATAGGIKAPTGYMPDASGTGLLAIPGGKEDERQKLGISALERGIAAAQQGIDAIEKYGSFETGAEAKKRDQYITNELVSAQSMLSNSGILNPSEAELYASRVPQQSEWGSLFTRDDTAKAKLQALREQLSRRRDDMLKAQNKPLPEIPPLPGT